MLKQTLLSLTLMAAAIAQPPGAGPGFDDIKTYMNLSDAQLVSIRQAGDTARNANQTVRQQIAQKQTALDTAIANGSTDAAAIGRAILEIAALRKSMDANMTKAREQASSFLSADQRTKLKALEEAEKCAKRSAKRTRCNCSLRPPAPPREIFVRIIPPRGHYLDKGRF